MKELVEVIIKALVDNPDGVTVTERQDGRTTVLEGRIAKAIRSVVKAAAARDDKRVVVDIIQ